MIVNYMMSVEISGESCLKRDGILDFEMKDFVINKQKTLQNAGPRVV